MLYYVYKIFKIIIEECFLMQKIILLSSVLVSCFSLNMFSGQSGIDVCQVQNIRGTASRIKPLEDRYFAQISEKFVLAGVFDGSGISGSVKHLDASQRLQDKFGQYFFEYFNDHESVEDAFRKTFAKIEEELFNDFKSLDVSSRCDIPSSTAACLLIDRENNLAHLGHIGDSRIVGISKDGKLIFFTEDHKPNSKIEYSRIQSKGGWFDTIDSTLYAEGIGSARVVGGFNAKNFEIDREKYTIGGKGAIIVDCEYSEVSLQVVDRILIFSDGVTEKGPEGNDWIVECQSAEDLIKKACENGSKDDITAMYISLPLLQNGIFKSNGESTMARPEVIGLEPVAVEVNNKLKNDDIMAMYIVLQMVKNGIFKLPEDINLEPVVVEVNNQLNNNEFKSADSVLRDSSFLTKGKVFCFLSVVAITAVIGILCSKFVR